MPKDQAARTADVLGWADLHGVDSHGISMIVEYDGRRRAGRLKIPADAAWCARAPFSVLIDGGGGLGHVAYAMAADMAIAKAKEIGICVSSVRNSSHFGAVGYFTNLAAEAGLIGMGATSAAGIRVAPTGAAEARLGTDPWSFSAPSSAGKPFLLDMATTTVAYGKIRNKMNEGQPMPVGWGLDGSGLSTTDPLDVTQRGGSMTPLGGTREGEQLQGLRPLRDGQHPLLLPVGRNPHHRPDAHEEAAGFRHRAFFPGDRPATFPRRGRVRGRRCGVLRVAARQQAGRGRRAVLVAGDPQWEIAEKRSREGIPIGPGLRAKLRKVAADAGVAWTLDEPVAAARPSLPEQQESL